MKSILDPKFRYTSSVATDIRKTFVRFRKQTEAARAKRSAEASADLNAVIDIFNVRNARKS